MVSKIKLLPSATMPGLMTGQVHTMVVFALITLMLRTGSRNAQIANASLIPCTIMTQMVNYI